MINIIKLVLISSILICNFANSELIFNSYNLTYVEKIGVYNISFVKKGNTFTTNFYENLNVDLRIILVI
jgi:hypothetical protein